MNRTKMKVFLAKQNYKDTVTGQVALHPLHTSIVHSCERSRVKLADEGRAAFMQILVVETATAHASAQALVKLCAPSCARFAATGQAFLFPRPPSDRGVGTVRYRVRIEPP